MAKSIFQRGILDYLPDPLQQQPFQQPAVQGNSIAQQLAGGLNQADPWGSLQSAYQQTGGGIDWGTQNNGTPDWGGTDVYYAKAQDAANPATAAANAVTVGLQPKGPPTPTTKRPDGSWQDQYGNPMGGPPAATPDPRAANAPRDPSVDPQNPGATQQTPAAAANPQAQIALPAGWNGAGNKFSFNIPAGFSANANMYQMGYDPNQDTARIGFAGGNGQQTNFDRVYGWMNAIAQANGVADVSMMTPAQQAAAASYAIGRLRTDSFATDPTGAAWRATGFAGYDRYLAQAGPQSTPGGNPRGQGAGQPPTAGTPGQPPAPGTPPAAGAPPAAGTPPGTPPAGAPPPVDNGPGGSQNRENAVLAGQEEAQMRLLLREMGLDPDGRSIIARTMRKQMDKILPAVLSTYGFGAAPGEGPNPEDNLGSNIRALAARMNSNGGFNQHLNELGTGMMNRLNAGGSILEGLSDDQTFGVLNNITNLRTRGMSPLMQQAYFDHMARGINNAREASNNQFVAGNGEITNVAEWLRNSQWADLLR